MYDIDVNLNMYSAGRWPSVLIAMSSDMEIIVKKMFTVSLMYGAQLCFALR